VHQRCKVQTSFHHRLNDFLFKTSGSFSFSRSDFSLVFPCFLISHIRVSYWKSANSTSPNSRSYGWNNMLNLRSEASASGLLVPEVLYSPVAKYFGTCFKIQIWIDSKFCKFISKRKIISLMHSSILRRIWLNFMALCLVFIRRLFQFSHFFSDFQLFRPEHHWRDLSSRNVHLVHQNCYRISFTSDWSLTWLYPYTCMHMKHRSLQWTPKEWIQIIPSKIPLHHLPRLHHQWGSQVGNLTSLGTMKILWQ
jgi:hypothetical protein